MNDRRTQQGVSLVELVITLVLIGILAAVGASRFFGTRTYDQRGFAGDMVSALRYAQKEAIVSRCEVAVSIDSAADSYALSYTGSGPGGCPAQPVTRPWDGQPYAASAPGGVDVQSPVSPLTYRPLGSVSAGGMSGATSIKVGPFTIEVQAESGVAYVPGW